jgi:hypothetical protein
VATPSSIPDCRFKKPEQRESKVNNSRPTPERFTGGRDKSLKVSDTKLETAKRSDESD